MKRMLAVTLCTLVAAPALAADVGVSVAISQPGAYGRIDIGRFPRPQVIVPQPVIILPPGAVVGPPLQPIYMWVPPGHRKNWAKDCARYRACGVPVYFVRHDWYDREVRGGREQRGHDDRGHVKGKGAGEGKGKREGMGRGDSRGDGRGAGRGEGGGGRGDGRGEGGGGRGDGRGEGGGGRGDGGGDGRGDGGGGRGDGRGRGRG